MAVSTAITMVNIVATGFTHRVGGATDLTNFHGCDKNHHLFISSTVHKIVMRVIDFLDGVDSGQRLLKQIETEDLGDGAIDTIDIR